MPHGYEVMRDKFYQAAVEAWYKRNKGSEMSSITQKRIMRNAKRKAAKIWNSSHDEKVSRFHIKY